MKKRFAGIILACCLLTGCGGKQSQGAANVPTTTAPAHTHAFGEWTEKTYDTCKQDGQATRVCKDCGETETRVIPAVNHKFNKQNICEDCWYVKYDTEAEVAELGIITDQWYLEGADANTAWDVKVWKGKVYKGAGDYDLNSGKTTIVAYNIATGRWENTGTADDEAVQRFIEIDGKLYTTGIDPLEDWDLGNYYVLQENGTWEKIRNLPNGIHNFDMTEFDGKLFAGLGADPIYNTTAYSTDGGKTFIFAPLYKDGALYEAPGYEFSRTYEFMEYKGQLYGLMQFRKTDGSIHEFYRYEDGKMVYVGDASGYTGGRTYSRNYFSGKFEFNGRYYLTAGHLYGISDFSGKTDGKKIQMPGGEGVVDALLQDDTIYVLATAPDGDKGNKVVIYKSTTGEEGSFEEVTSFHYPVKPCAFDMDGSDFYIGMDADEDHEQQSGMLLRVRPTK